jgi:hypothetical protein
MASPESTRTAAPSPAAVPPVLPPISPGAVRIVLFGMPAAGKSSLLGAAAQAAQTQEHLFSGRLNDQSHGLAELQHRLYEERARPTSEEVAPYPVEFEPFVADGTGGGKVDAVFIDCDGRVANDLLARRRSLADDSPEGTLAREVMQADCLVLVVDAAAPAAQVEADFAEFGRFLRLLERSRGQRSEIGGLPVFLVLTKCDLLAQPDDSASDWMERIEERKRQVHQRFQAFLSRQHGDGEPLPFGRIDLHLWATAVKRPPLKNTPARPREPYGVAELMRQSLEYAQHFHQRRRRSGRRLLLTVFGAGGLVAAMTAVALGLFFFSQAKPPVPLEAKVRNYLYREEQTTSGRLREPLQPKIGELTDLLNDKDFSQLPPDLQAAVHTRLDELLAYRGYLQKLREVPSPATARSEGDLDRIEDLLKTKLVPPEPYGRDWGQTEAALLREKQLDNIKLLREAVENVAGWYDARNKEGRALLLYSVEGPGGESRWANWYDEFRTLLQRADNPDFREKDPVPGSTTITYETVLRFNRVRELRSEWEAIRKKLERVRDLAAALGLISGVPDRPPVLVIPRPPQFSAVAIPSHPDTAVTRLDTLRAKYPNYEKDFTPDGLEPSIAGSIHKAAQANFGNLLEAGQERVLRELQRRAGAGGRETPELWRDLLNTWLRNPADMDAWRTLALVLSRLAGSEDDPLKDLTDFLKKDQFDLELRRPALRVNVRRLNLKPAGRLQVFHFRTRPPEAGKEPEPALVYEVTGRPDESGDYVTYSFRQEGSGRLQPYQPGDVLYARLPVEYGGNSDWLLTWAVGRSQVFQFEHLTESPVLHLKNQAPTRDNVTRDGDVTLEFTPPVPAVPALVPKVKLGGQ